MSCSPFDLKDYFLKELPNPQQREVERHVQSCQVCRQELDRLQLTEAALFSLRNEEIPQRIAFVSDKVFEPSPWRRGWAAFWGSAARLGFVSAAMLSVALLVSALVSPLMRPAPVGRVADPPKALPVAASGPRTPAPYDADIQARIDSAVAKAVAEVGARQIQRTAQLVADLQDARKKLLLAAAEYDWSQKRANSQRMTASAYQMPRVMPGGGNGEAK
jgi:anti-sigma factor RsiW